MTAGACGFFIGPPSLRAVMKAITGQYVWDEEKLASESQHKISQDLHNPRVRSDLILITSLQDSNQQLHHASSWDFPEQKPSMNRGYPHFRNVASPWFFHVKNPQIPWQR